MNDIQTQIIEADRELQRMVTIALYAFTKRTGLIVTSVDHQYNEVKDASGDTLHVEYAKIRAYFKTGAQ